MAVSLREVVSFGRYEPLFRIASGGMAEVYAARIQGEAGFQKLVAVKRMHPHIASDQSFVDMFLNEARLAAHISSPHVVTTQDLGRGSDGSLYIVMELVVGLSLASLADARRAALPVPIALELLAQAAQGLDDAHEATTPAGDALGLIHRDVSPHNMLLGVDGRLRVTDFGIARAMNAPRAETNAKVLKGKFAYMSPEQTRLRPLDRRSDLFSLGIVLWEALVGTRLFAVRDPVDCIRNVRSKLIPPPHALEPRVPPAVSRVVLRALERMPSARYQTGAEFAEALRQVARDELDSPPTRKEVSTFVREAGGEELTRLQRLIRLGTEGAEPAEMEAASPGSTKIVGGSGVSLVGASRDGARTVPASPAHLRQVATVILPEDDASGGGMATEADLDEDDARFLALAPEPRAEDQATRLFAKVAPNVRTMERASAATATLGVRSPAVAGDVGVGTSETAGVPETAGAGSHDRFWLAGGVVAGAVLLILIGLLVARERPRTVPLPGGAGAAEVASEIASEPEPEPEPEPEAAITPEPESPGVVSPRQPRRRRGNGRNRPRVDDARPELLDVNAFDRVAR